MKVGIAIARLTDTAVIASNSAIFVSAYYSNNSLFYFSTSRDRKAEKLKAQPKEIISTLRVILGLLFMQEKTRNGYVTGLVCLLIFFLFLIFAFNNEFNLSGQIIWVITIFFGALGFGSLWKPDSIGEIATQILKNLSESGEDTSDSHNIQIQEKSSGAVQAMATQGASVTINVDSKKSEVYSLIHTMIKRVNREVPRKTALQLTAGAWVDASLMDFNEISALFNQHSDKFRDEDLDMWLEIEKEIKTKNGFFLGKRRQAWFDYLETEYNRLKRLKQTR